MHSHHVFEGSLARNCPQFFDYILGMTDTSWDPSPESAVGPPTMAVIAVVGLCS